MLLTSGRHDSGGFTLVEVLVMLLLLSLLAAAVFPVVTRRVSGVEPARAAEDLVRLGDGLQAFGRDLGGVHAATIGQLLDPVGTTEHGIVREAEGVQYSEMDSARWSGPYLDPRSFSGGPQVTGFGVPIRPELTRFDGVSNAPSGAAAFRADAEDLYLAVRIGSAGRHLTPAQFEAINDLVDGEWERDGPGPNSSWTLGRLRFDASLQPADSIAYFLAVPLPR